MNQEHPVFEPPRPSNWETDGVGISPDGFISIRDNNDATLYRTAPREHLSQLLAEEWERKQKWDELQRRVNAREPHRFLSTAIADLEAKAKEAGSMRGDGAAGKVMWGQEQAYRDAIALLKSFTE